MTWTLEEKRKYHREWMRRKRQTPEYKEWSKEYHNRPEVKARKLAQGSEWVKNHPEKKKIWRKKWWSNNPQKTKLMTYKQNARRRAQYIVGNVDIPELLDRWDGLCGICHKKVEGKYHIDHIIPLSRGGLHEQDNLQVTHPLCNWRKNNRILPNTKEVVA